MKLIRKLLDSKLFQMAVDSCILWIALTYYRQGHLFAAAMLVIGAAQPWPSINSSEKKKEN